MDTLVRGKGEWGGERQCNWQYFTFRSGSARGVEVTWGGEVSGRRRRRMTRWIKSIGGGGGRRK